MAEDQYDVAVVGAGPGGSAAAITLARAGLRVALIDRQTFPRTKPCGDLIGCGGIALARTLGVDADSLAPYPPLRGAVLVAPETRPLVLKARRGSNDDARVIPRHIFDSALVRTAERAGATFVHLRVRDLVRERGAVVGVAGGDARSATTIRVRAVIGADGYGSRIARAVRGDETTHAGQIGVALRAYATGFTLPRAWDGCLIFAYDAQTAPGYGWLMPLPGGGANIGIGTLAPATETVNTAHLRDLFDRFVAGTPWLAGAVIGDDPPPRTWPLALAPRRGLLVGDGVLLVGEAAALVGPMTGAGIYPALQSGVWAAEALIAALHSGDVTRRALLPYERRVHRRFLPQHRAEAWAQRLLTNPARLRRVANAVRPLPFAGPLGASLLLHLG
ncbi:MAG TPA: geranylgeranyl reductase family protein [Thermomicrobiales bacterium]